jgi:release factor glutamine methyltransferase
MIMIFVALKLRKIFNLWSMDQENLTVRHVSSRIRSDLGQLYPAEEIQAITELIFENLLEYSKTDLLLNRDTKLPNSALSQINEIVNQLQLQKPIQYILGEAWFYGIKLRVTPDVLIPRQETEELVKWILDDVKGFPSKILDIGTGSGCIAIALALNIPLSQITATDISEKAVTIARENAAEAVADIDFIVEDIFNPGIVKSQKFDIIVSNPPYVTESEKRLIEKNVLHFEPVEALFVPDMQALKYYFAIASLGREILRPGGKIYFEINENKAAQLEELLAGLLYTDIEIKKDINGKCRMARAILTPR